MSPDKYKGKYREIKEKNQRKKDQKPKRIDLKKNFSLH
jgi:hypothetical protein